MTGPADRLSAGGSAAGAEPIVELIGVHKHFGANHVLRGIDIEVGHHEVVCFIGGSGCGKSTLLRCVNALEPIQAGLIRVAGEAASGPGSTSTSCARRSASCSRATTCSPT